MDIDMHYYGTYALACAAGLREDVAKRIATAAEFVDDSTDTEVLVNPQGARFRGESTAHHPAEFAPNNNLDDQIAVWLPFHFLPGGMGDTQSQKLVCVKDSKIAQRMVAHHLDLSDSPFAVEMIGMTAHVYADTFAHFGFSGVSSRLNRVVGNTISLVNKDPLLGTLDRFVGKFGVQGGLMNNFRNAVIDAISSAAEDTTGALGHGSVATFPDQPYLEWSYQYERPELVGSSARVERQNTKDYFEACEALYNLFAEFAKRRQQLASTKGPRDYAAIKGEVWGIVSAQADRDARIGLWKKSLADGKLATDSFNIEVYDHQLWRNETSKLRTISSPQDASAIPAYHFHQASAMHRNYVLRDLLPDFGIYVI